MYPVNNSINNNRKRGAAEISNTSGVGAQVSATGATQVRDSTGIKYCYYEYDELKTLSKEQHNELNKWRKS